MHINKNYKNNYKGEFKPSKELLAKCSKLIKETNKNTMSEELSTKICIIGSIGIVCLMIAMALIERLTIP